ncbi:MAG: tRNA preQ1(34) S-adenosylmethionine ribosyltransferase-isomerase QueA, partial [Acidobacteriota bacterium]|nr:tRNA preQ1(34) S-adenosylmethionine ribosyltransferase-isomerase QueA [Acidobacteriota bacterium]
HRQGGCWEDRAFREFPEFLHPGDCVVLNDSRVFPSRLFGHRAGVHSLPVGKNNSKRFENLSGRVEVFLLRPISPNTMDWEALVRPGRKMRVGERVLFDGGLEAEILSRGELGQRTLRFHNTGDIYAELERIGHVPLPPYIKRPDSPEDRDRYQTVFARARGSVAAPTAGLHFTPEILEKSRQAGAAIARITLHVGLGTFQPIHTGMVEQHRLHAESYAIDETDWSRIAGAQRVVAVGTTSVRTVESVCQSGRLRGETDLFIYPGFEFRRTGAMLTNFHLPRTSLLLLVCALAGRELTLAAYRYAVRERYRFFSYGDCMLVV